MNILWGLHIQRRPSGQSWVSQAQTDTALTQWTMWMCLFGWLKDRITLQVNFFQKWAPNVVAGTGKEGKTKEVVKERKVKTVVRD